MECYEQMNHYLNQMPSKYKYKELMESKVKFYQQVCHVNFTRNLIYKRNIQLKNLKKYMMLLK